MSLHECAMHRVYYIHVTNINASCIRSTTYMPHIQMSHAQGLLHAAWGLRCVCVRIHVCIFQYECIYMYLLQICHKYECVMHRVYYMQHGVSDVYLYIYTYVYSNMNLCICIYIYIYVYMCVCICVCIYTHTHTHTETYNLQT